MAGMPLDFEVLPLPCLLLAPPSLPGMVFFDLGLRDEVGFLPHHLFSENLLIVSEVNLL